MPGIAGIISRQPAADNARRIEAMIATMRHEKFYTSGTFSAPEVGVSAGWVAMENTFADGQVFHNESGDVALLFCGECFPDPEIKNRLRAAGHIFPATGGSWLVHFYEERGEHFFAELNGLFSGLLIDRRRRKIFLFNDRYGAERIYWHETTDAFYFASEAKALLRELPELREFDREGVAHFLAYGSTLAGRTLFRGVDLLPGGSLWKFAEGECVRENYFPPATWESQPVLDAENFQAKFSDTFNKILPRYFASESKIGLSLTAGLDSRMVMACRPVIGQKPVCYTFDGARTTTLDARIAGQIAQTCGLEHHILRIGPDFFSDFAAHADRTIFISDGYFGATGAHEIYLNRQARALAPVRLGGAFGGEILREVSTFKPRQLSPQLVPLDLLKFTGECTRQFSTSADHRVTFAAFKEIPWNIFGSPAICRAQLNFRTPYLDNEIVALAYQLPESLRRSPQLALRVVQDHNAALGRFSTDMGYAGEASGLNTAVKRIFCKAAFKLDYLYTEGMPHVLSPADPLFKWCASALGVQGLHKYLLYRSWFRRELADYVRAAMAVVQKTESPFWNSAFLARMVEDHIAGRGNYVQEINTVLTLNAVERLLFRELPK